MIVVDCSAIVAVLAVEPVPPGLGRRIAGEAEIHAPHLLDVEFLHALRRFTRTGAMSRKRAASARADFSQLSLVRYAEYPLADRMWELRDNVSAYDAAYVALAEALRAPVVTCDGRLARSSGHHAQMELFQQSGKGPIVVAETRLEQK